MAMILSVQPMPNPKLLKIGDKIRLLCVPERDLAVRERELRDGDENPGWTANTIERVIAQDPIVTIWLIDEYGRPWFECFPIGENGIKESHSICISDDASWEFA